MATKKTRCERYWSNVLEIKALWEMLLRAESWNMYKTTKWSIGNKGLRKMWQEQNHGTNTRQWNKGEMPSQWMISRTVFKDICSKVTSIPYNEWQKMDGEFCIAL